MDEFVENTLKKWNLADLVERFRDEEVDEEAFLLLTPDIIKELIPKLGRRAIFTARFTDLKASLQANEDHSSAIASPSPAVVDPDLPQPSTSASVFPSTEVPASEIQNNDKQFEKYFLEQLTSTPFTSSPSGPNSATFQDTSPCDAEDDPAAKRIKLESIEVDDEYGSDSILLEDSSQDSLSLLVDSEHSMNQTMNDPEVSGSEKLRLLLSQSPMTRDLLGLKMLDKSQRMQLIHIVVHYIVSREKWVNPSNKTKHATFEYWADAIVALFPLEQKATYYASGGTGKLQQRFANMQRKTMVKSVKRQRRFGEGLFQKQGKDVHDEGSQSNYDLQRVMDELQRIVSSCFVMRDTLHAKILSPNQRNILTANIVNYLMDKNGGPIALQEMELYAKAIEEIFPNENASIYFRRQGTSSRVNGKLFDRYGYMKRKRSVAQGKKSNDFLDSSTPIGQMWDMNTVEEARALWNETHMARKEVTRKVVPTQLFEKFPFLAQPDGYTLFLDDFNHDHPDAIDTFKRNWPEFATNIYRYIQEKDFLQSVTEFSTHDYELDITTSCLIILPLLFKLSVRNEKHWSPTRLDVSRNFVLYATDFKEAVNYLKERQQLLELWRLRINPVVVAIGPSISDIESCYIVFNQTYYKMDTVQDAVETCVKMCTAMNLKYLDEVASPWMLVQRFVMKVELPKDNITTKVFGVLEVLGRPLR